MRCDAMRCEKRSASSGPRLGSQARVPGGVRAMQAGPRGPQHPRAVVDTAERGRGPRLHVRAPAAVHGRRGRPRPRPVRPGQARLERRPGCHHASHRTHPYAASLRWPEMALRSGSAARAWPRRAGRDARAAVRGQARAAARGAAAAAHGDVERAAVARVRRVERFRAGFTLYMVTIIEIYSVKPDLPVAPRSSRWSASDAPAAVPTATWRRRAFQARG